MFVANIFPGFVVVAPFEIYVVFRIELVCENKHFKCVGRVTLNRHVSLGSVEREGCVFGIVA